MAECEPKVNRGEIWQVNFDPAVGSETNNEHPAVIVDTREAGLLPLHIVVPVTTGREEFRALPWMVYLEADHSNGLDHNSWADAFQVKSISTRRFVHFRGRLSGRQVNRIVEAILFCIGYDPPEIT